MGYGSYQYLQPNVITVQNEQEISMYRLAPNSLYAFYAVNEQTIFYVQTDAVGKYTITYLDFVIRPDPKTVKQEAEMNELRNELAAIKKMLGGIVNESTVSTGNATATGSEQSAPAVAAV